jgi:hypothetical protein
MIFLQSCGLAGHAGVVEENCMHACSANMKKRKLALYGGVPEALAHVLPLILWPEPG